MPRRSDPDTPARPDLFVVARFLDRMVEADRPYTKAKLQMAVGLNYDTFQRYLALLEERGWAEIVEDPGHRSPLVKLTPAGKDVHHRLITWLREILGRRIW